MSRSPDAKQFYDPFFPPGCDPYTDRPSQDVFDAMMMDAARPSPEEETIPVAHHPRHPLEHGDPCSGQRFDAEPPDPSESWDQELKDCPPACEQEQVVDDQQQAAA